jgi:hypothetical protein
MCTLQEFQTQELFPKLWEEFKHLLASLKATDWQPIMTTLPTRGCNSRMM